MLFHSCVCKPHLHVSENGLLEVVSHWHDPQPQVSENYSDLTNGGQLFSSLADLCRVLFLESEKAGT